MEESWLYKGSLCWKLEWVPSPPNHGGMPPTFLCNSKFHVPKSFNFVLCESSSVPSFCSICLCILFFYTNCQVLSINEFILLIIKPLPHIRNWVATLYGLIVSLLGSWHSFTTSWLLGCTCWAQEWHVRTLNQLWNKSLFSITIFISDDIMPVPMNQNTDHFSECVERHAYSTYDKFLKLHEGKTALVSFSYDHLVVEHGHMV